MTKEYTEQLGRWVKERASTKRDVNVVAFLVVREDVRIALEEGHAAKTLWKYMYESGRIGFCYDTFLRYVNRYIRNGGSPIPPPARTRKPDQDRKPALPRPPATSPAAGPAAGFIFNATPNKEDLL